MVFIHNTGDSRETVYKLSSDAHWTDVVSVRSYSQDDLLSPGEIEVSYSSGGTIGNKPASFIAERMIAIWQEASRIIAEETEKHALAISEPAL